MCNNYCINSCICLAAAYLLLSTSYKSNIHINTYEKFSIAYNMQYLWRPAFLDPDHVYGCKILQQSSHNLKSGTMQKMHSVATSLSPVFKVSCKLLYLISVTSSLSTQQLWNLFYTSFHWPFQCSYTYSTQWQTSSGKQALILFVLREVQNNRSALLVQATDWHTADSGSIPTKTLRMVG